MQLKTVCTDFSTELEWWARTPSLFSISRQPNSCFLVQCVPICNLFSFHSITLAIIFYLSRRERKRNLYFFQIQKRFFWEGFLVEVWLALIRQNEPPTAVRINLLDLACQKFDFAGVSPTPKQNKINSLALPPPPNFFFVLSHPGNWG